MNDDHTKIIVQEVCRECTLRTEVDDLKSWLKTIIILAITNLLALVGGMALIIFKMLPAFVGAAMAAVH